MTVMVTAPHPTREAPPGVQHVRVPWPTVLGLAVVAAFGNGFWLVSARGAVGAIERTRGPFLVWLQESSLLLPLYVFAVLAALTLALRWFGPGPLRARTVLGTLLVLSVACTLAALSVQAVSAVYDYRLQVQHVANMALHMPTCDLQCVADRRESALLLQVRALGLNGVVMLVSNLVLIGLVVAFRGGRLEAGVRRPGADRLARHDTVALLQVIPLLGAAAIHATAIGDQLDHWSTAGVALLLLAIAQMDAALLFLIRLGELDHLAAVVVSAGPLLVWLCAHTVGLPVGPNANVPSQIGLTGSAAAVLEATTLAVALSALAKLPRRRSGDNLRALRVSLAGVVAVSIVGMAAGLGVIGVGPQDVTQGGGVHVHGGAE
jgi:hypothetical protein